MKKLIDKINFLKHKGLKFSPKTNYNKLYNEEYFNKNYQKDNFNEQQFLKSLVKFCEENKLSSIINFGPIKPFLKDLSGYGHQIISCNLGPVGESSINFDLIKIDDEQNNKLLEAKSLLKNENFLVTCFNILECIDKEDLSAALFNLRTFAKCLALVSISTRPSRNDNIYHSSILPINNG